MATEIMRPSCWLVSTLEWPTGDPTANMAECAIAVTPRFYPRRTVSDSAYLLCSFALEYSSYARRRVVFLSDLAGFLREHSADWLDMGVTDWEAALAELHAAPVPSMYLTLSRYAYLLVGTAGMKSVTSLTPANPVGQTIPQSDFDECRVAVEEKLRHDWPLYIEELYRSGKVREA